MGNYFSGGTDAARGIGSALTNPVDGTRVCLTGALARGAYLAGYLLTVLGANQCVVDIRLRNAGDTASTWAQRVVIPAATTLYIPVPIKDTVQSGEFYDCALNNGGNLTGTIQGSVWCVNVG